MCRSRLRAAASFNPHSAAVISIVALTTSNGSKVRRRSSVGSTRASISARSGVRGGPSPVTEAIHMIRKGQAYGSAAGAKVGLVHRFILGCSRRRTKFPIISPIFGSTTKLQHIRVGTDHTTCPLARRGWPVGDRSLSWREQDFTILVTGGAHCGCEVQANSLWIFGPAENLNSIP
jgi:hypothetical protein